MLKEEEPMSYEMALPFLQEWDRVHVEVVGSRPTGGVSNLLLKKKC